MEGGVYVKGNTETHPRASPLKRMLPDAKTNMSEKSLLMGQLDDVAALVAGRTAEQTQNRL